MSGGIFVRRNDEELLLCVIDQIVAIFATIFNGERQIISIQQKKLRIAYLVPSDRLKRFHQQ